jgi:tetratricopeptide (TPR) repeat protein
VHAERSVAAGRDQTVRGAVVTGEGGAAASEGGAVAISGGVAATGPGPTFVALPGATINVNYYVDGLPQAAPEVRDHFKHGQRLQEAHEHEKAIAEFQTGLAAADTDARRGALHLHIGISQYLSDRLVQAEGSYMEALRLFRAAVDQQGQAAALGNLGVVYLRRRDLDRAEEHHKQALQIDRRIDNPLGQAQDLGNLGNVYADRGDLDRGDLDRAEEHYKKALEIFRRIDNPLGQANQLGNLGILAMQRGRPEEARHLLAEALALYERIGAGGENPDTVRAALRLLEEAGGEEKPRRRPRKRKE